MSVKQQCFIDWGLFLNELWKHTTSSRPKKKMQTSSWLFIDMVCWKAHLICTKTVSVASFNLQWDSWTSSTVSVRPHYPGELRKLQPLFLWFVPSFCSQDTHWIRKRASKYTAPFTQNSFFQLITGNKIN